MPPLADRARPSSLWLRPPRQRLGLLQRRCPPWTALPPAAPPTSRPWTASTAGPRGASSSRARRSGAMAPRICSSSRSHGVLALHARCGGGRPSTTAVRPLSRTCPPPAPRRVDVDRSMRRVFALDGLACPDLGGGLQVIAVVRHPLACRPSSPTLPARPRPRRPVPCTRGRRTHLARGSVPLSTLPLRPAGACRPSTGVAGRGRRGNSVWPSYALPKSPEAL
jgi:hypothetical protein